MNKTTKTTLDKIAPDREFTISGYNIAIKSPRGKVVLIQCMDFEHLRLECMILDELMEVLEEEGFQFSITKPIEHDTKVGGSSNGKRKSK